MSYSLTFKTQYPSIILTAPISTWIPLALRYIFFSHPNINLIYNRKSFFTSMNRPIIKTQHHMTQRLNLNPKKRIMVVMETTQR